jgi:predicted dienelactone hydrolase
MTARRSAPTRPLSRPSIAFRTALSKLLAPLGVLALAVGLLLPPHAEAQSFDPEAPPAASLPSSLIELPAAAPFQTLDLDWFDAARQRAVPVRLYLPKVASAEKPVPLVVFSHGIGGSRRGYSYLGQFWAGQGYASLHLQHVGSDRTLWQGNVFGVVGRLQAAAQESEAVARVQDLKFALDQLLDSEHSLRVDARRIVAAGHSYGANTTLLAVGARVEREGRAVELRDARLKGAIVISAPPFYGEKSAPAILGGIEVPTLHVTATEDVIRVPGYYSPASDRLVVFDATGGQRKTLAVFNGGSHSIFTDRGGTGDAVLNPQVKRATQLLSLAFLRRVFEEDSDGLVSWPQRFGDLVSRFSTSP